MQRSKKHADGENGSKDIDNEYYFSTPSTTLRIGRFADVNSADTEFRDASPDFA
jgi:hypothetical protein